jgi:hypothetical protein
MKQILGLVLLFFCHVATSAQNLIVPAKFQAYVEVHVSADEENKSDLVSFISRELRALGDVTITSKPLETNILAQKWDLRLVAVPSEAGITVSAVFLRTQGPFTTVIESKLSPKERELLGQLSRFEGHYVLNGTDSKKICEKIVAKFDAEVLSEGRLLYESMAKSRDGK